MQRVGVPKELLWGIIFSKLQNTAATCCQLNQDQTNQNPKQIDARGIFIPHHFPSSEVHTLLGTVSAICKVMLKIQHVFQFSLVVFTILHKEPLS